MTSPARPRSSLRANLLLALVSTFLFLGLGEIVTRLVDLRPSLGGGAANPGWLSQRWLLPRDDYREGFASEGFLGRYYDLYEWDRYRFFRLRPQRSLELNDVFAPEASRDATRWSVRTGRQGYRSDDFEPTPTPGRRRVVAIGDSSTFGWGVEAEEAYPARLDAALDATAGGDAWEVLNLGVPGYSSFQGTVMLGREALPLQPDVVTWSYIANDGAMTGESDREAFAQRLGWVGGLVEWLHRSRLYETLEAWIGRLRSGSRPREDVRNISGYAEAEENVNAAVVFAREAGVPIVLVANCVRGPAADVLARVAAQTGTPYLDATRLVESSLPQIASEPRFASDRARLVARYGADAIQSDPRLLGFLPDLCHPNAVGHRLIGEALAGLVEKTVPTQATP